MSGHRTIDYFAEPGGPEPRRCEPGDLYVTTRTVYRVLTVRPVESRKWHDRWALELEKVGERNAPGLEWTRWAEDSTARFGSCSLHYVGSYERGETPRDFAAANGYEVEPRDDDTAEA